ncbi:hypothetical protein [Chitinophaga qingshengii]|uniref:Uncharacterized protein n=1 Tax=Chitinophaga qingshengii TaxID=1569794 RepID=A0ABR7TS63_9BACT|nr:hypothetical protein [Chitinophaga qingshengii]MBC9933316.1 hypothetical protein [Chitinophaga qingshengii]
MRKKRPVKNLLSVVNECLNGYANFFRTRVCEECRFSTPTFYRKLRSIDQVKDGKLVEVLTGAETSKIRELVREVRDRFVGELDHLIKAY